MKGVKISYEATKILRNLCHAFSHLHVGLVWLPRVVNAIKFLLFMEDNPKHRVIELEPWHAIATFLFAYIMPQVVFGSLIAHGLIITLLGEIVMVLGVLEVLHIALDS